MWKVYPQRDPKEVQDMCECTLHWVIGIGDDADARDFERHADERIAEKVLALKRDPGCEKEGLLDTSVYALPYTTPTRTTFELTAKPERLVWCQSLGPPIVSAAENLVDGRGRATAEEI